MKTSIIISLVFFIQTATVEQYTLILAYYEKPISNKAWEIKLYRNNEGCYISSSGYEGHEFTKKMDQDEYSRLVLKLHKLGVFRVKSFYAESGNGHYELSVKSRTDNNVFKIEDNVPLPVTHLNVTEILRTIKNYARLYAEK